MSLSVAIRGAGAAGLSFAHALLRRMPQAKVSVFDKRARLPHPQRTFCFFADAGAIIPVPTAHSWSKVAFSGKNFTRSVDCSHSPYSLTRGQDFFEGMLNQLEGLGVSFTWNCDDISLSQNEVIHGGRPSYFDVVVDAAYTPNGKSAILWQSFAGLWVESETAVFHPEEALLMGLEESNAVDAVKFAYVLPTSKYTALIEYTSYSEVPLPECDHLKQCRGWLKARGLDSLHETSFEAGAIPLGMNMSPGVNGVFRVGSGGGAIRASTGFAYQAIQRQSEELAQQIESQCEQGGSTPIRQQRAFPMWMETCDRLFLQALANAPRQGSNMMAQLLGNAPEHQLLKFLSGQASILEALQVMVHVPKLKMIEALLLGKAA